MLMNANEYNDTLERIVDIVERARVRAAQSANAELVRMYWNVGGEINAHAEWGSKYIDSLSRDIRTAFPQIKGFSVRSLKYMAKFNREVDAELCSSCCTIPWGHIMLLLDKTEPGKRRECDEAFLQTVSTKMSWSHIAKLLDKLNDDAQRAWYGKEAMENGWYLAVLDHRIDLELYERQAVAGKASNFTCTLPTPEDLQARI